MKARAAKRQTRIYTTYLKARSHSQAKPVGTAVPVVDRDFFLMLDAPFMFGGPWSASDDEAGAPVLVLSRKLNDKLFAGANSVGKTLDVAGVSYRVAGVLKDWAVVPRFYDLHAGPFNNVDEMFMPFNRAIRAQAPSVSGTGCLADRAAGWEGLLHSDCIWIALGGTAGRGRCRLSNLPPQLRRRTNAQRPFPLAGTHSDSGRHAMAQVSARGAGGIRRAVAGIFRLSVRVFDERHGIDARYGW